MSTRWYPLYQKGNPQLRVFLPNFWMKLLKPKREVPKNVVHFACSMEMGDHDIKNYLTKIYDIPVCRVHSLIETGRFRRALGANYIVKDDDVKIAVITLPPNEKFEFPDLFSKEGAELDDQQKQLEKEREAYKERLSGNQHRPGIPSWFSI